MIQYVQPRSLIILRTALVLFATTFAGPALADASANYRINIDLTTVSPSEHGNTTRSVKTTGCHKINEALPVAAGDTEIRINVDALNDRSLEFTIELLDGEGNVARSTSTAVADQGVRAFDLSGDSVKVQGKISRRGPECLPEAISTASPDRVDTCDTRALFGTCVEYTLSELDDWYREHVETACSNNSRGDLVGEYRKESRCPAENRVARCEDMIEDPAERYEYDKHYYTGTADGFSWKARNVQVTCDSVSGKFVPE